MVSLIGLLTLWCKWSWGSVASSGPASSLISSGSLQLRMCVGPSRRTPASLCRSPVASVLDWMRGRRGLWLSLRFQCSHGLCFDVELSRPASFITASLADHSDFRVYTRSCTGRFPSSCAQPWQVTVYRVNATAVAYPFRNRKELRTFYLYLILISFKMPVFYAFPM